MGVQRRAGRRLLGQVSVEQSLGKRRRKGAARRIGLYPIRSYISSINTFQEYSCAEKIGRPGCPGLIGRGGDLL